MVIRTSDLLLTIHLCGLTNPHIWLHVPSSVCPDPWEALIPLLSSLGILKGHLPSTVALEKMAFRQGATGKTVPLKTPTEPSLFFLFLSFKLSDRSRTQSSQLPPWSSPAAPRNSRNPMTSMILLPLPQERSIRGVD